jgi:Siphovirus Gp157
MTPLERFNEIKVEQDRLDRLRKLNAPNLTLYNIEHELLEVLQLRDEVASDPDMTPQEIADSLQAIDQRISEYVKAEVRKVDGVAAWIRECDARQKLMADEVARLDRVRKAWEARGDRIRQIVIAVMQETGQPKLQGATSVLRLQKNPPSVEVSQPGLVPAEYQRVTVTMPLRVWHDVQKALMQDPNGRYGTWAALTDTVSVAGPEPAKLKIAAELKQNVGVPGCSLVTDKVHLRIV